MGFLKVLLTTILISFCGKSAQAQFVKSLGLRTGWCSTKPDVREERDGILNQRKIYNLNLVYLEIQTEYLQKDNFSLLTNLSYIPKGYAYYSPPGGGAFGPFPGGTKGRVLQNNVDYISIMAAPKFSHKAEEFILYGFTGLHLGILGPMDSGYQYPIFSTNPNSFTPFSENELVLNRFTWGGVLGLGIETDTDNLLNYSLQAQYLHDFSMAADYNRSYNFNNRDYSYRFKMKYQTFLLGIGFHYSFNKKT